MTGTPPSGSTLNHVRCGDPQGCRLRVGHDGPCDDARMVPCAPPLTIPPRHPNMVFTSWRAAIADAHTGIETAQEYRRRTFRAAADAGLSRREIGEACGLSSAAVQKIIGKDKRVTLDSIVGESS